MVVTPDAIAPCFLIIGRHAKGIVDADEHIEKPCQNGQDFVCPDSLDIARIASRERIGWEDISTDRRADS